jgi:hypothetical protein
VTGEISTLKHELRDDTVEGAASISLDISEKSKRKRYITVLSSSQFTEIPSGPWDNIVIQLATQNKPLF